MPLKQSPLLPLQYAGGEDTLVLQDLLFSLGHNQTQREQGWLATILRVSKNDKSHFPFTGPMLEAFQYVSSISTPEGKCVFVLGP